MLYSKSECGTLMRGMDWSANPLGLPERWPAELRTVVSIALGSTQPMLIVWGPEQTVLYNDGYAKMCGLRHPAALGGSFRDLWFDIWDQVEPIIDAAYAGISTAMDDIGFIMHRNGYPEETHFSFSYTPVRNAAGEVLGMFCACNETTTEVMQRRRLQREQDRLRHIFENAIGAVAVTSGPDHRFTFANAEYELLTGNRGVTGKTVAEALPEVVDQGIIQLLDQVYASGRPYHGRSHQIDLQRSPNQPLEHRILDFVYYPIPGAEDDVSGIFVQALDVTEHHRLHHELAHRLKNQLTLVMAIVNMTFRAAEDLDDAREAVMNRIAVLSRAHDAIISGEVQGTTVDELMRSVTALQAGQSDKRLTCDGPSVHIAPKPSLSLSLILHELMTNAVKYGALSVPEGRVLVQWQVEGNRFRLVWQESGGPPVSQPERTGSGTALIEAGLNGTRNCAVTLTYAPEGLCCDIRAELVGVVMPGGEPATTPPVRRAAGGGGH